MTRLFLKAFSDTCKNKTMTGHESQCVEVYYGSKKNSMRACKVWITYPKGQERPLIQIATTEGITTFEIKGELK